jgi:hypothetical protein
LPAKVKRFGQGVALAIILLSTIVLMLGLADHGDSRCLPPFTQLKLPMDFPGWLGCALAKYENLAAGLIGGAGALFAAWVAWQAIMRQIEVDRKLATLEADRAYEALQVELQSVVDMLDLYWRVVDAAIHNRKWRQNGGTLLRSLHPPPEALHQAIDKDLGSRLDPIRRRHFLKLMESLSWLAQQMKRPHDEPRWFENVRTMLSHFDIFLQSFDPEAAKKFRQRKKTTVDHRSMAAHLEPLIAKFERDGNI